MSYNYARVSYRHLMLDITDIFVEIKLAYNNKRLYEKTFVLHVNVTHVSLPKSLKFITEGILRALGAETYNADFRCSLRLCDTELRGMYVSGYMNL